jgi:hypothetical protein
MSMVSRATSLELSDEDVVLCYPSAGFRQGHDVLGKPDDVLAIDPARPAVGAIAASTDASQLALWAAVANQHRTELHHLRELLFARWREISSALITVQLRPDEVQELVQLDDDSRARVLRCLWPVLRICVSSKQLGTARLILREQGISPTLADAVTGSFVEACRPGVRLADPSGESGTICANATSTHYPYLILSSGHGRRAGGLATVHSNVCCGMCASKNTMCVAAVVPSESYAATLLRGSVPLRNAAFIARWSDHASPIPTTLVTVADVAMFATRAPQSSESGVNFSVNANVEQPMHWNCHARYFGATSIAHYGDPSTHPSKFDFNVTGIAYRFAETVL